MTSPALVARTPAKLNLGLEVLRRRLDGYHDILTVMQAIDIVDELIFLPGAHGFEYVSDPSIDPDADFARPIFEARARELGWTGRLELCKGIPVAAGLGGGSSDAALAIRIAFAGEPPQALEQRAAAVGSDVPFLIHGGAALASGAGTTLEPVSSCLAWFLIVVPDLTIDGKTGSMYAALTPDDFSSGAAIQRIASALRRGEPLPARLPNAFERLMLRHKAVAEAWAAMRELTGRVALSGAGPAVYSWFPDETAATAAAAALDGRFRGKLLVARGLPPHYDTARIEGIARALRRESDAVAGRGG